MSAALSIVDTIKGVITKKGATVSDAVKALKIAVTAVDAPAAPLPKSPALPAEVVQTLTALPGLLASVELPDSRRELTTAEREEILDAVVQIKEAAKGLDNSLAELKTAAFNHFDAVALSSRRIDPLVPQTKEGWFVLEDKESFDVEGQTQTLTREVRNGSVAMTEQDIASLEAEGSIDHVTYLRWTKQIRVVDEDAIMVDLKKSPDLIGTIAKAAKVGSASAALYVRKAGRKKK